MDLWRSRGAAGDTRLWPVMIYDSVCVCVFHSLTVSPSSGGGHLYTYGVFGARLAQSYRIVTRGVILQISISKVDILAILECAMMTHMNNHLSLCKQKLFHWTRRVSFTVVCNVFVQ